MVIFKKTEPCNMTKIKDVPESLFPEISQESLLERMQQIRKVKKGLLGFNGSIHEAGNTPEEFLELFVVEPFGNIAPALSEPKEMGIFIGRPESLIALHTESIHTRMRSVIPQGQEPTLEEVLSQIPRKSLPLITAFEVNLDTNPEVLSGQHDNVHVTFYGKRDISNESPLPSWRDLVLSNEKKIDPHKEPLPLIINWEADGFCSYAVEDTESPLMEVEVFSEHKKRNYPKIVGNHKLGKELNLYFLFDKEPMLFKPSYTELMGQIRHEFLTEHVVGLLCNSVRLFKTSDGVIHEAKFFIVEKI